MVNRKNLGYQFEKEFGRWLSTKHIFTVKLPDTRSLRAKVTAIAQATDSSFQELTGTKTPCDFWSVHDGRSYMWECKHTMQESLPFNRIAPHQDNALKAHYLSKGASILVVGYKNKEAYCINYSDWITLQGRFGSQGRKSVPITWIRKLAKIRLERKTPKDLPEKENKPRYVEVSLWD